MSNTLKYFFEPRSVAIIGASKTPGKAGNEILKNIVANGFAGKVFPINPSEEDIMGFRTFRSVKDIPEPVDMVDIFRASAHALPIVEEALALKPRPQVIWMQLGVRNDAAAAKAEAAGLKVVMNRCPKIEYGRLYGELGWSGINTNMISSKRRQVPKR